MSWRFKVITERLPAVIICANTLPIADSGLLRGESSTPIPIMTLPYIMVSYVSWFPPQTVSRIILNDCEKSPSLILDMSCAPSATCAAPQKYAVVPATKRTAAAPPVATVATPARHSKPIPATIAPTVIFPADSFSLTSKTSALWASLWVASSSLNSASEYWMLGGSIWVGS